jgi:hypothetical protein
LDEERAHLVDVTAGLPSDAELPEQLAVLWVGDGLGPDPDGLLDALHARLSHGAVVLVHPGASETTRAAVDSLKARVAEAIEGEGEGVGPGGLGWRVASSESSPVGGAEVAGEA